MRRFCVFHDRKEEEFASIQSIAPWDYRYSEELLYNMAMIAVFYDDMPDVGVCVLSMVSKYKMAGVEFLDYALNIAKGQDAKNFENTIMLLQQEIEKIRQDV